MTQTTEPAAVDEPAPAPREPLTAVQHQRQAEALLEQARAEPGDLAVVTLAAAQVHASLAAAGQVHALIAVTAGLR